MTNTKTLMLAAVAALSIGVSGAMAQESAGGFISDHPAAYSAPTYRQAPLSAQPQAGSSDVEQAPVVQQPALYGAAGNGG